MHKIDGIVTARKYGLNACNLCVEYMMNGVKQAACKHLQAACLRVANASAYLPMRNIGLITEPSLDASNASLMCSKSKNCTNLSNGNWPRL